MKSSAVPALVYEAVNKPVPNPFLVTSPYAITHFDSSQSDSTPYGPMRNLFTKVDPTLQPLVCGGPINIITLASTKPDEFWQVGSDRVSYVSSAGGTWKSLATFPALNRAASEFKEIPNENFLTFGKSSAVGMNTVSMDAFMKSLFGDNYADRAGNGAYVLVDNEGVLYAAYADTIYGFQFNAVLPPSITPRYRLDHVIESFEGITPPAPSGIHICGLSMTYDGYLIVTFTNGVGIIDRKLNIRTRSFYRFANDEFVSNSIAVDENNGIYVASNLIMRKLVWKDGILSGDEKLGAWKCAYKNSGDQQPPIIKVGNGTGSTPTLMGFGNDPDKLVVITDGAPQMNLVAFWRDEIPTGLSQRIAGLAPVTCGFTPPLPTWIQSEQSVVVHGYGAFVVNNIPQTVSPDIQKANKLLQVALMGPAYPTAYGAERFEWSPVSHKWASVWARPDVSSTSMVPIHTELGSTGFSGNMALINGYMPNKGWEVLGLDWDTGKTVHETIFGDANFGNGAYAILQYFDNKDLLFNSISGPLRVHYGS